MVVENLELLVLEVTRESKADGGRGRRLGKDGRERARVERRRN